MDEFHVGPYMTAVGAGEILTEVRLAMRPGGGSAHEKVERRAGDWAIAAASAAVWIDGGQIVEAGVALSAVGPTTVHADRAAGALRGNTPGEELFAYVDDEGNVRDVKSEDVNEYLHEITGEDFTAKDFRTWAGTVLAAVALRELEQVDSQAKRKKNVVRAVEEYEELKELKSKITKESPN